MASAPEDSLLARLKHTKPDSSRVNLLDRISDLFVYYQPAQAEKYARQALVLARQIDYPLGEASALNHLALASYRFDRYKTEIPQIDSAFRIYERLNYKRGLADCYLLYSEAYYATGEQERSLDYCYKALKLCETQNYRAGLGRAYYNLGIINKEFENNVTAAAANMEQALGIQRSANDARGMGLTLVMLGDIYEKNKQPEKALAAYTEAHDLGKRSFNRIASTYAQISLGNYFLERKEYNKAREHYTEALSLCELTSNDFGKLRALKGYAKIARATHDFPAAIMYTERSLATARRIGDYYGIMYAYEEFTSLYEALGKPAEALRYNKLYTGMRDTVFNMKVSGKIAAIRTQDLYERKMVEKEMENAKEQALALERSKRQRIYIFLICGALFFLTVITLIIWRSLASTRKQKQIIEEKNKTIEQKNKDITDSINYAERIQRSFLASAKMLDEGLRDYFILFRPKDVVSGDFYWAERLPSGEFVFVVADSTGHGVPGAIMSLLNITSLERAAENSADPAQILNEARRAIIERLRQNNTHEGGKDGMDCTLMIYDRDRSLLRYACANNHIWIVRKGELLDLPFDRMPVGRHDRDTKSFTAHEIHLEKGDMIYTVTDGMADQFGGPEGKKLMYRRLKSLFTGIASLPTANQRESVEKLFDGWKGDAEQVDDVTVAGIRVL